MAGGYVSKLQRHHGKVRIEVIRLTPKAVDFERKRRTSSHKRNCFTFIREGATPVKQVNSGNIKAAEYSHTKIGGV
jgi:hypothetical protein